MSKILLCLFPLFASFAVVAGPSLNFTSPEQQTTLLELYTSEGCSSCPPADRWLSTLKDDPRLWKEIIPVAFHVDYWNYLGWTDKFSKPEYSQRQREYAAYRNVKTDYTPGFLRNGFEWRAWFRNRKLDSTLGNKVGQLQVNIKDDTLTAKFTSKTNSSTPLRLHIAWLGFELSTEVQTGENGGETLRHDFVCFETQVYRANSKDKQDSVEIYNWSIKNALPKNDLPTKSGIAVWISREDNPTPIQATGGWL